MPASDMIQKARLAFALIEHMEDTNIKPKKTICLWFDKDANEAARFYAATFPDSRVTAVHEAPGDYPGGKKGDVFTVEFTVVGIPYLGLNGGPAFSHPRANRCDGGGRWRTKTRLRGDEDDEENRHSHDRGSAARLT
jgi:3-demethylubiquinone-9 3-methyltransferase